jgi:hypothetical protein
VLTALQYTSQFPKVILENFYVKSRNSVETGRKETVAGYVIPGGQRDTTRVALLVNMLRMQGIEVGRATAEVKLKDGTFPAGSFVVKRDQPYSRLAKILLERQVYPDPNLRTYDDASWTMGLMSHTEVKEIADKTVLDVAVDPVTDVKLSGGVSGAGSTFAVAHNGSNNMIALRYRLKDLKVQAAEKEFKDGDRTFPAGSFVVSGDASRVRTAIEPLGLTAVALSAAPSVAMHDLDLPRVAVYSTWGSTQDVGWVRYAFDKFEVPYDLIYKERVRQGNLKGGYDVIVVPNQAGTGKRLVFDIESRGQPIAYKKSEQFKNLGAYGESDDITGGMGVDGVAEFDRFVKAGGVLVTLGTASFMPAEFGLTPRVDAARTSAQFYSPGAIIDAEILQPDHPIFYGYDKKMIPVRYANGPRQPVRRSAAAGAAADAAGRPDALPGRRRSRAERADARRERDPQPAGDRRSAVGKRAGDSVRRQPVLPLAELRRVQHAVQRAVELQRHQDGGAEAGADRRRQVGDASDHRRRRRHARPAGKPARVPGRLHRELPAS